MTRKRGWEEPTTGPDWTDVEAMMRAIGALHSGTVGVSAFPDGIGSNGGLSVAVMITFDVLPGSSLPESVGREAGWPCDKHPTLASHVFSLLYDLDFAISQVYKQESLWK